MTFKIKKKIDGVEQLWQCKILSEIPIIQKEEKKSIVEWTNDLH